MTVGINYRYFDSLQKLKNLVDEGKVGDIVMANSELILNGPFAHPLVPTPASEWWFDKEKADPSISTHMQTKAAHAKS